MAVPRQNRVVGQLPALSATLADAMAAGLGWATVFGLDAALGPIVVASTVPVLVAGGLAFGTRWPLAGRVAVSLGVFAVVAAVVAERRPPTPAAILEVADGVRNGWRQILSSAPLAEPTGGPMVTAMAVAWLGALGCAELTLRTRRVLLPLLPPLAGFAVAIALGAGGAALPRWIPALLTATAGGWLLIRAGDVERFGLRRWLGGAATIAFAALAAVAVGPQLPGAEARPRFDPRTLLGDPVVIRNQTNPLATLTAQVTGEPTTLFMVSTGRAVGVNWRVAVLDRFEGNQWTSTATFNRIGGTIAPSDALDPDVPVTRVTQDVVLRELDGWFLPAVTRPVEVDVSGLATDDDGVLVVPTDTERPTEYTVVSSLATVDSRAVQAAVPVRSEATAIAGTPDTIRRTALDVTADQRSAYGKLVALRNFFRDPSSGFVYDNGEDAPTGNSFNAIETLVETRQGTAEQFASAFAVMAADLGYHTRVVVGYLPGGYDDTTGTYTVTTHQAHAWPEVEFEELGWVAFEPSPLERRTVPDPEDEAAVPTTVPDPVPSNTVPAPGPPTTLPAPDGGTEGAARAVLPLVLIIVGLIVVAVVGLLVLTAAKAARRRRRQRGSPAHRVAGAWRESMDRLVESGVAVPTNAAAAEIAAVPGLAPAVGVALARLADIANRARFGGVRPAEHEAAAAWVAEGEVAAGADRDEPWSAGPGWRSTPARCSGAAEPPPGFRRPDGADSAPSRRQNAACGDVCQRKAAITGANASMASGPSRAGRLTTAVCTPASAYWR